MELKRLIVVGAGAVGGSVGGLLSHSGRNIWLVARGEHGEEISSHGLLVKTPEQEIRVSPSCVSQVGLVDWCEGDAVLLATKLQDAKKALQEIVDAGGRNVPLICGTNGVLAERWAKEQFSCVVSMLIWMPTSYLDPGEVVMYSGADCRGVLDLGPTSTNDSGKHLELQVCEELSCWLKKVGFDSRVQPNIQAWKHAKWITNLANAAQALVTDDWKSVGSAAKAEGESVLDAAGIERVSSDELKMRCQKLKMLPVDGLQRAGGSTWQSLHRGKPLETEWIEGAMVKLADEVGVDTPILRFLNDVAKSPRPITAKEVFESTSAR